MSLVLIAGTNSWDNDTDRDWYKPEHPFWQMLVDNSLEPLSDGPLPFIWTTDLDGVPGTSRKNNTDWAAGGAALCYFSKMHGEKEIDAIAHSHAIHVVYYAAAHHNVKFRRLMTMGSPVRKDMMNLGKIARENIGEWIHVHSDKSDKWQWLGEMFDGKWGIVREHPLADKNESIPKVGHSELLRDPQHYHFWKEKGWIDFLCGTKSVKS